MQPAGRHPVRAFAAILAVALSTQLPMAQAGIVDTDALEVQSQAELDRAKVQAFMDRANVKERLQAMGVNALLARDRVESLSEAEVHALAQRIDTMPAGAALTTQEWILVGVVALLLLVLL